MIDPLFWLGLSILLVAVSLTAVLVAALPALQELARAARSAEKLFDTLRRDLPPTLDAIRLTGLEISDLTDNVSEGVKSASQVVQQVDQGLDGAKKQAQKVQVTTKSVFAGVKTAWKTLTRTPSPRRSVDRLSPAQRTSIQWRDREAYPEENPVTPPPEQGIKAPEPYQPYNHKPDIPRQKTRNASTRQIDPEDIEAVESENL